MLTLPRALRHLLRTLHLLSKGIPKASKLRNSRQGLSGLRKGKGPSPPTPLPNYLLPGISRYVPFCFSQVRASFEDVDAIVLSLIFLCSVSNISCLPVEQIMNISSATQKGVGLVHFLTETTKKEGIFLWPNIGT